MGSVRKRTWRGRDVFYIDYIAASGERIRQTIGPGEEGRRLARRVLAQREAEAQLGIHRLPAAQTMRFADYARQWLERRRPPRVRPNSWAIYSAAVERLLPAFGAARLGAITRERIETWLVSRPRGRPHHPRQGNVPAELSVTTLNDTLKILRTILEDAVQGGHLSVNAARRVKRLPPAPRPDGRVPYLTPAQMDALLAVAEEPYRTLYRLAIEAGLRRGEILALRWGHIDRARSRVTVRGSRVREQVDGRAVVRDTAPKTGSSVAVIEDLSEGLMQALLALPAGDDPRNDYVFADRRGMPLEPNFVYRVFQRHLRAAGLPPMPFHALRHTCATLLLAAGEQIKVVQARMRHATARITLDTYGHLLPGAFAGLGDRLEVWLADQREGNGKAKSPASAKTEIAETRSPTEVAPSSLRERSYPPR